MVRRLVGWKTVAERVLGGGAISEWDWSLNPGNGYQSLDLGKRYSILMAYQLLSSSVVQSGMLDHYNYVWNKVMSLKVSLLVWKMLRNCIPTKGNLIYRGIIPPKFRPFLEWLWAAWKCWAYVRGTCFFMAAFWRISMKVRKTQEGGLNCVSFFFFLN